MANYYDTVGESIKDESHHRMTAGMLVRINEPLILITPEVYYS
jgi:hypothetical protein